MSAAKAAPQGNGVWKVISCALFGVVVSLSGTWAVIGQTAVTAEQVSRQIQFESPYAKDQEFIRSNLQRNEQAINRLAEAVAQIKSDQAAMHGKLDALLKHQREAR